MRSSLVSVLVVLFASPAFAADLPTYKASPVAPFAPIAQYDWTGVFVGANFGWSWSSDSYDAYRESTGAFLTSGSTSGSHFHAGGQVGYNYMFPSRLVIGATASLDWGSDSSTRITNGASVSDTKSTDGIGGDVLAKIGYAFGDFLPYIDGGWAWNSDSVTRTQLAGNGAPPAYTDSASVTRNGWDLGAGLQYHVWGNWEIFAEYDHKQYARISVVFPNANIASKSTLSSDAVTMGVNYKF
jgi:opacity protein-like surface antigen